ncbi:MAG: YfhO family protein [Actinobacteria bacterium]|nr:YfhO family protein [Actinomycetota bacterium]
MINWFNNGNGSIDSRISRKALAKEYIIVSLILIILVVSFLWQVFFAGKVLLPADMVNTSVYPWLMAEGNSYVPGSAVHNGGLSDPIFIYYPMKYFLKSGLDKGTVPLWNSNAFCGYPYLSKIVSDLFNPLDFLFLVLPAVRAFGFSIALHLFLAGLFMYMFVKSLRINRIGALFAAIVFMFNANTVVWLEFPTHLKGELWIPLIFMFIIKYYDEKRLEFSIAAGIFLGMQILSGYNQAVQFTVIAIAIILLINIIYDIIDKKYADIFRKLGATILTGVIALLMGLCFLLPFYREFMDSNRAAQERSSGSSLNFRYLLTMLDPDFFGNYTAGRFWLRGTNFIESVRYSGIATLLLAATGLVFSRARKAYAFFAIPALAVLINSVPFVYEVFNHIVPFFNKSEVSRILMLVPLSLAVLSGYGMDFLSRRFNGSGAGPIQNQAGQQNSPGRSSASGLQDRPVIIFTLLLSAVFILTVIISAVKFDTHIDLKGIGLDPLIRLETFAFIFFFIMTAASTVLILAGIILQKFRRISILLLIPLIVVDLFAFGMDFNTTSEESQVFFEAPSIEYIKQDSENYRVLGIMGGTLNPNSAWIFDLQDTGGYDPVIPMDYASFWTKFHGGDRVRPNGKVGTDNMNANFLNLTNTKYIMSYGFIDSRGYFVDNLEAMKNQEDSGEIRAVTWNFMEYIIPVIEVPPDSRMEFDYHIGKGEELVFYISTNPGTWNSGEGNGVTYRVFIEEEGKADLIYEKPVNPVGNEEDRRWYFEMIDLSGYEERDVSIVFETDSNSDVQNDKPGWGNPRILQANSFGLTEIVLLYNIEVKVYRNYLNLPRAFLTHNSSIFKDNEEIITILTENDNLDLMETVFLEEKPGMPVRDIAGDREGYGRDSVEVLEYGNNYVKIKSFSEIESYLVLLDRYHEDWQVYIDGKKGSIIRADYLFRAVYLDRGEHIIEFRYEPGWFILGVVVSVSVFIISIIAVILLMSIRKRKRRKGIILPESD